MVEERTLTVGASAPRAADASAGLCLLVFCGGQVTAHALPRTGEVVMGRGEDTTVRVDHVTVSRRHATLLLGTEVRIVDHGSFNGTKIGGRNIAPHTAVPVGLSTIVELGETMIVVQVAGAAPITTSQSTGGSAVRAARSPAMQHLYRLVDNVAQSNITVIVRGETGSGKEVVSEEIHRRSARAAGPLVKLNCAALPEHLLEGELFGYERGAFTGAAHAKAGLIESADGGTLFLDEIGEMPPATQAKLLRVVESREVMRLGSLRPKTVDVRFLAATHRDLEEMVTRGQLRQDLYYRLAGVTLVVPPLRERATEIPQLAEELVARFCSDARRPAVPISSAAMRALERYSWPGNVRELRNVIERAVVFCSGGAIAAEHLGLPLDRMPPPSGEGWAPMQAAPSARMPAAPSVAPPPPSAIASSTVAFGAAASLPGEMEALERQRILDALARCGGNQTEAAQMLGISRRTLLRRLDEYAVPRPRK
jgi:DNA-binding NtrC family response regulator